VWTLAGFVVGHWIPMNSKSVNHALAVCLERLFRALRSAGLMIVALVAFNIQAQAPDLPAGWSTLDYKLPEGFIPTAAPGAPRFDMKRFLENRGVTFPEGSAATYIRANGHLFMRNTEKNIDRVRGLVAEFLSGASQEVEKTKK
jgi:hypothetical protein